MFYVSVDKVPYMDWMSDKAKKVVKDFNRSGKHLALLLYEDEPESREDVECLVEEGQYEYSYPNCPESKELKKLIEEAAEVARYIAFNPKGLIF